MRVMTLAQIAAILNVSQNTSHVPIRGYTTDSRLVKEGELFFALKGERVDGHDYLAEVASKGAVGAIVSKDFRGECGMPLLAVDDPLQALQQVAHDILAKSSVRVVAITGSIGKTTTKEFTRTLLSQKFRVAASPGNSNSQVGVPLAILNHTAGDEEILVLEMGMTVPGNLARLIQIAPPEVAVLTNVALVHACNFEAIDEIAWAKAEILSHPQTKLGIIYEGIPQFEAICKTGTCKKISFSTTSSTSDYGIDLNRLQARLEHQSIDIGELPVPGKHNLHNLLAAIAVARHFHMKWEEIKRGISQLALPERRLQFVNRKGILFLNDSYNASELSVKAALETLPQPKERGRKIAVLGSMMELGKFSDECHRRVGEHALEHVEQMFCLGEECHAIHQVWEHSKRPVQLFKTRDLLVASLREHLKEEDVVLLKGSRSKELWKVLEEF